MNLFSVLGKRALPKMPRHEGFRVSLVPRTQTDDR